MNRRLLYSAAFVLSVMGGTQVAHAAEPGGHSFCIHGAPDKNILASDMEKSLAAHPDGNGHVNGCYATMNDFFVSLKAADPTATNLNSIRDLPAYVRRWTTEVAKKDYLYSSDCLYENRDGSHTVGHGCVNRDIKKGEVIYKNPDTGALTALSGCANPGPIPVPPIVVESNPCLQVHFPTEMPRRAVRIAYMDNRLLPSNKCTIALQIAGESAKRTDLPEECPDKYPAERGGRMVTIVCTWDAVEEAASGLLGHAVRVQNVSASFYIRATGDNVLYLPQEALNGETAICYELPDGTFKTVGVRRRNFIDGVATITPVQVYGH